MASPLAKKEYLILAQYAVKISKSVGRRHKERIEDERLPFQRDKDRIIHSKAFRRLDEKTQVFMAGSGDHYRTRLTHTLEVAQIARDIARRLSLNEDLCEAIALAHDLGHPPFGHAGEAALNDVMKAFGMGFEHNEQSRRVVEQLEKTYPGFDGLNLTIEVLDGLIKHQSAFDQAGKIFEKSAHLEAQVVNVADEIAYTNHDMDDGLRADFIKMNQLRKFKLWQMAEKIVIQQYGKIKDVQILKSRIISTIISLMIEDFCKQTHTNLKKNKIKEEKDVINFQGTLAHFSGNFTAMIKELRSYLYDEFYMHPEILNFTEKGKKMIKALFKYYFNNTDDFPAIKSWKKSVKKDRVSLAVVIKDYIAGMTDRFLVSQFNEKVLKK